jgi:hypothetical protein
MANKLSSLGRLKTLNIYIKNPSEKELEITSQEIRRKIFSYLGKEELLKKELDEHAKVWKAVYLPEEIIKDLNELAGKGNVSSLVRDIIKSPS